MGRDPSIKGWNYSPYNPTTNFNDYAKDSEKINAVFSNPALLKVFKLQCDLFSIGKIKAFNKDTKDPIEKDPLLSLLKKPNPFQTQKQLLWDFMFWNMLGNSNLFVESKIINRASNTFYFLDTSKIEYPQKMLDFSDKLVTSKGKFKEYQDFEIIYRYANGKTKSIKNNQIIKYQDLTNGVGSWFKGRSAIDALYKVISNSELSLDAKNVNLLLSKKFMVSGKTDIADVNKPMLGKDDKETIEKKVLSEQNVHAVRSMIDIKRFVENIEHLKLNEAYTHDYHLIGSMYGIPKEVLDAYAEGSTYENQEKAIGRHVGYSLQPKGDDFISGLENYFDYGDSNADLTMSWDHLPFMQVFEADRAKTNKEKAQALEKMVKSGADPTEAAAFLGIENVNFDSNGQTKNNQTA